MKRLWFLLVVLAGLALSAAVQAQTPPNRVGLVVRHGDGQVLTACVEFSEPTISGAEVLIRAGLGMTMDAQRGGMICSLDGEGCQFPAESCFCECETLGAACTYWAYFHLADTGWVYSQIGASTYQVKPGGVEGWGWGRGTEGEGAMPPVYTFDQLCADGPSVATLVQEPGDTAATPSAAAPPSSPAAAATHRAPTATGSSGESGASASPSPAPRGTEALAPTEVAVLRAPSPSPAIRPAAQAPTAPRGLPTGYLAFGAIVLLLLAGMAWNQQRSRR